MNTRLSAALVTGAALALTGCDAPQTAALPQPQTTPLTAPLAEAPMPEGEKVMKYVSSDTGGPVERRWSFAPGKTVAVSSTGCTWTQTEMFGPATSWKDCGGSTGTATVAVEGGDLWPLAVGKSRTWVQTRTGGDNSWTNRRTCTVAAAEVIRTPVAERTAYRVDCDDSFRSFSVWYDPAQATEVHIRELVKKTGVTTVMDEAS